MQQIVFIIAVLFIDKHTIKKNHSERINQLVYDVWGVLAYFEVFREYFVKHQERNEETVSLS